MLRYYCAAEEFFSNRKNKIIILSKEGGLDIFKNIIGMLHNIYVHPYPFLWHYTARVVLEGEEGFCSMSMTH